MLLFLEREHWNLLWVEASGELTRADHIEFLSQIENMAREVGRCRVLIELIDFDNLETASGWEDPLFSMRDRDLVRKLAIVGPDRASAAMKALAQPFTDVCFFAPEQRQDAMRWVLEGEEDDLQERIRRRAYARWEAAGRPQNDSARFWMEAEQEVCPAH